MGVEGGHSQESGPGPGATLRPGEWVECDGEGVPSSHASGGIPPSLGSCILKEFNFQASQEEKKKSETES